METHSNQHHAHQGHTRLPALANATIAALDKKTKSIVVKVDFHNCDLATDNNGQQRTATDSNGCNGQQRTATDATDATDQRINGQQRTSTDSNGQQRTATDINGHQRISTDINGQQRTSTESNGQQRTATDINGHQWTSKWASIWTSTSHANIAWLTQGDAKPCSPSPRAIHHHVSA